MSVNIKEIVERLTIKYGTRNPYELADYLNLLIIKQPMDMLVKGFYQYYKRNGLIYINSNLKDKEQLQVCSHELGHAVMHTKMNIVFLEKCTLYSNNPFEIEANKFAAELLLPDDAFKDYFGQGYTLQQVASDLHLHIELVKLKLEGLSNF